MIVKTKAFTTSDGTTHATLELAQLWELTKKLTDHQTEEKHAAQIAGRMIESRDEFVAILCATGRKPRKMNGPKKRKERPIDKVRAIGHDIAGISEKAGVGK